MSENTTLIVDKDEIPNDLFWKYPTSSKSKRAFISSTRPILKAGLKNGYREFMEETNLVWVELIDSGNKTGFHFKSEEDVLKFQMKYL